LSALAAGLDACEARSRSGLVRRNAGMTGRWSIATVLIPDRDRIPAGIDASIGRA
jgi:hypothetical protein